MSLHQSTSAARATARAVSSSLRSSSVRSFATVIPTSSAAHSHKVVVIGGGTAGLSLSHQLLRSGRFTQHEIVVIDPATWHHYQPGWTLVGGGIKVKEQLRKPMESLVSSKLKFYNDSVASMSPGDNFVTLGDGSKVHYDQLIVVPGIKIDYGSIEGLPEALANPNSPVSSIYGYETCDKVFATIQKLKSGVAIFTQPTGVVKCAGAPQKAMWLALDYWKRAGLYNPQDPARSAIKIQFATGLPTMFGVPKYNAKLEELRKKRAVEGLFQHDLVAVHGNKATFAVAGKKEHVTKNFDLMHVVPKMGPHEFVKTSALANEMGFVDVDEHTTRSKKYNNVWSVGDASSLPTSKTVAAITAQVPVLVRNLLQCMDGKEPENVYDGYTSCPLVTEYGKVLLAEFKYGGEPKETFGAWFGIDQSVPRRAFYHLKKDFFPWVYDKCLVKGTWAGPKGWIN